MTKDSRHHPLRHSEEDRAAAQQIPDTPQTRSDVYKLAYDDLDFLLRDELRPVRLQLELLKPEMIMQEAGIESTVVLFGGARIPRPEEAHTAKTETLAELSKYYTEAREFSQVVSRRAMENGHRCKVIVSGGGPGVMEAASRGAHDVGGKCIGLNIVLPHEQAPNHYVTPYLSFRFHYFALRKMHFLLRARAVAVFPGGFGTFDEFFELLTLIQTGKMKPIPILLFGKEFWSRVVNFKALAEEGVISQKDLDLITWCETADEAWAAIAGFYELEG